MSKKKNYTHIAVLTDRSGSMASCRDDMLGGLTEFFKGQAAVEGKCLVDYTQFDDRYEDVYSDALVASARPILEPRGMTALLDALGKKITSLDKKLSALKPKDRPNKVIFIVVTDGQENASREYKRDYVKYLIEHQQSAHDWDFVFLGADIGSVAEAKDLGFRRDSTLQYYPVFATSAMDSLNHYATRSRTVGTASFSDAERLAAMTGDSTS